MVVSGQHVLSKRIFRVPGLADIDEALIRLLYDPRIKLGMTIGDLERMGL